VVTSWSNCTRDPQLYAVTRMSTDNGLDAGAFCLPLTRAQSLHHFLLLPAIVVVVKGSRVSFLVPLTLLSCAGLRLALGRDWDAEQLAAHIKAVLCSIPGLWQRAARHLLQVVCSSRTAHDGGRLADGLAAHVVSHRAWNLPSATPSRLKKAANMVNELQAMIGYACATTQTSSCQGRWDCMGHTVLPCLPFKWSLRPRVRGGA
jgi:hypothetical protein